MAFGNALAFPFHRTRLAAAVAWSPAKLFEDGEAGGWYDLAHQMNEDDYPAWQTVVATDRADEVGDPIGLSLSNPRDGRGIVNRILNQYSGGSAGSPGVPPTSWVVNAPINGLVRTLTFSTDGGAPVMGVRFVGTSSASTTRNAASSTTTAIDAAQGQTWTARMKIRLIPGTSLSELTTVFTALDFRDASGNLVGASSSVSLTGLTTEWADVKITHTAVASDVAKVSHRVCQFSCDTGAVIDFGIEMKDAMLYQGAQDEEVQYNYIYLGGPGEHFGQATSAARPTLRLVGSYYMLEFDGGDYLTLGKPALSDGCSLFAGPSQRWVVSGVFQFVPGEGSTNRTLVAKAASTEASRTFHSFVSETAIGARVRGTPNSFTRDFSDGNMHWYLFYWDGTKLWLYVDDDSPLELTVGSATVNTDEPILIGARTIASPTTFFTGYQQLLVLRSGEISTDEIGQLRQWAKTRYGVA